MHSLTHDPPRLRPEAELLLLVASPDSRTGGSARFRSLLEAGLDWDYLVQAGWHSDILPLLYWHLNATWPELVPPAVLRRLQECFCRTSIRGLLLMNELVRLLKLFERHDIHALPFKGPTLAWSLYGNLALRPMGDLDVFVTGQDVRRAKQVLIDEGYRLDIDMDANEVNRRLETDFFLGFRAPNVDVRIELHWDLLHPRLRGGEGIDCIWDSVTWSHLAGQPVRTLRAEQLLMLLCIHGHRHDWERLKWIGDVGRLIAAHPDLNWPGIRRDAARMEQDPAVLMGAFLASSLLGVRLPDTIRGIVRNDRSLPPQMGLVCGRLFRPKHNLPGFREWQSYLELVDASSGELSWMFQPRSFLRYLAWVVTPNYWTRLELRVPRSFALLHYVYRPMQLVRRHGIALVDRLK
jgi:hypothetical protein